MQLVVLGMHRSGTSGVTRLLNLSGAYFGPPDSSTEANDENPKGFWERRDVRNVCDGLLQGAGFDWYRLDGFDVAAIPDPVRTSQLDAFATILTDLNEHRPWVVKEPRLCLLLPVLEPLLDDLVCVHVSRDPIEVARSVHQRNHLAMAGSVALWELYTLRALEASARHRRVHVRHEDVMADPVATLDRLLADLTDLGVTGLRAPAPEVVTDFISPALHRQRSDPADRGHHLNADQLRLAELLDAQPLPDHLPALSAGATDALRDLGVVDDLHVELRRLAGLDAALAHERNRRARLGALALESLDRAEQDIRAMTAGRTATTAAYVTALRRTLTPGLHRSDPTPFSRALAGVEQGRRRIRGSLGDTPQAASPAEAASRAAALVRRTRPAIAPSGRPRVAVVAWDVGHNPLGRANVLAEVLARDFDVELWGAQFERYGSRVWAPLRDIPTPINVFAGRPFPEHLRVSETVATAIDADAIWVSKPRLPSLLLGALAKEHRNRPLVLDVDDHELAFFDIDEGLDIDALARRRNDPALALPFERDWTRACDPLIGGADQLTVSNVALQRRYGGVVVPHARDERVFDPAVVDREAARHRLGIPADQRVLLFGGTPRLHKGVLEILQALETLNDPRYRLIVFGTREFDELRPQIGHLARWLLPLPYQPFSSLPEVVAAADLACILQNPDHPVSAYQLPAKLTDALAMGVPVLLRPTPPLGPVIQAGAVGVIEPGDDLASAIAAIFDDPAAASARAAVGRRLFLDTMSYDAVGRQMRPVFEQLLENPPPLSPQLAKVIEVPRALFGARPGLPISDDAPSSHPRRRPGADTRPIAPGTPFDVVMFWKQNDTGIYGRRQEMFVDQLVASPRVGTVVHFDNPITPEQLGKLWREGADSTHQGRLVVRSTLARVAGRSHRPGLRTHTFLYGGSRTRLLGLRPRRTYVDHVLRTLTAEGIGRRPWVLWSYPTNPDLPELIDRLRPDVVLTDVVDDNRTWWSPGTPEHDRADQNYQDVLSRSDLVLANCEPVAASMRTYAPEVHVVPNGVELDVPAGPVPVELHQIGRPLIGYVGNLSSRLDIDLLEGLAATRPDWQFAFVGSAHLDPAILRLRRHPNVHFLGVRPHREARHLIAGFDVALIPHLDNEMTQAMNPLKAFVYAGVGVPVVSTPIANLGELDGLITVAEGVDGFVRAIEHHLALGHQPVDRARLLPHTWGARLTRVLDLLDELGDRGAPVASRSAGPSGPSL
jgi:glycosyltransferase involved in cell wall biosynthesis